MSSFNSYMTHNSSPVPASLSISYLTPRPS
nr:MAG TPA: hypothetical protein [Caudoviricetes sp.]